MWLLSNRTPFAAERTWVRDRDGAEVWVVAVKGAFVIGEDGHQILDKKQTEVSRVPVFSGEPGLSSLTSESDLVHLKNKTDVIVHGAAYAPYGKLASVVDVGLRVGPIDKALRVYGDRHWERGPFGLRLGAPEPFSTMPVTYERAFGGVDRLASDTAKDRWEPANPVGTGLATRRTSCRYTGSQCGNPRRPYVDGKEGHSAGFGPIARHWAPRVTWAGTYNDEWEQTRRPLLPLDFDDRFYQCAPVDQQVDGCFGVERSSNYKG